MKRALPALFLVLTLTGCDLFAPSLPPITPFVYPNTFTPAPITTTPIVLPLPPTLTPSPIGPTNTPSLTPSPTAPSTPTASATPTLTLTPTPLSVFALEAEIVACNISLDVAHGMGEVTNAYVVIRNLGTLNAEQVCATLIASDEERVHPDKSVCVPLLEPAYQVTLKLTVDTAFQQETSVLVRVQTSNAYATESVQANCKDIGFPYVDPLVIRTPKLIQP